MPRRLFLWDAFAVFECSQQHEVNELINDFSHFVTCLLPSTKGKCVQNWPIDIFAFAGDRFIAFKSTFILLSE